MQRDLVRIDDMHSAARKAMSLAAELALEYGFTDIDGKQPASARHQYES